MDCADCLRSIWSRFDTTSRRGQYSIERMCELSEYCQSTPLWRVVLVFLVSVLPSLVTIVALDAMPLQDPYAGWAENWVMWIRVFVGTFMLTVGVMFQLQALAPATCLTMKQSVVISILLASVQLGSVSLLATYWAFPVPFTMVTPIPSWALALTLSLGFMIGRENLSTKPEIKIQLRRFSNLVNLTSLFLVIFPVYITAFRSLEGVDQFAFIFLLPVLKALLKKLTKKVVADVEELVPVIAITVDLFNALFQAKCMQTSGSVWTTVGIILIDAVQNAYTLRKLFRYMADVQTMTSQEPSNGGLTELFVHCMTLLQKPENLNLRVLRVQSLTPTHFSSETSAILQKLKRTKQTDLRWSFGASVKERSLWRRSDNSANRSFSGVASNAVVPWPPEGLQPPHHQRTLLANITEVVPFKESAGTPSAELSSDEQQTLVLKKTLELLWKCESVLLVEYIEAAVPLIYGVSISVLYYLPNAKYYPGVAEMTPMKLHSTIASILIYSVLEFTSLIYLHVILKMKFQISALHQLAFVLEKQWLSVQGVFLTWVILVLGFTLVHYGTYGNSSQDVFYYSASHVCLSYS